MQACDYHFCELEVGLLKKVKFKMEYPRVITSLARRAEVWKKCLSLS